MSNNNIAYDAVSNSGYQSASSGYSWNHTCTGSNGFLAVDIEVLGALNTVTALTYNGVTLSLIGVQNALSGVGRVEQWGLANPPQGTYSISVTLSGSVASAGTAVSYTGVNRTTPTEAFNSATATNIGAANATVNITTVANGDWVHAAVVSNDTAVTPNQTNRNNVTGTLGSGANEDTGPVSPAGSTTVSYGVAAAKTWAIAGYGLIPIVSGSGTPSSITRAGPISSGGTIPSASGKQRGFLPAMLFGPVGISSGGGNSSFIPEIVSPVDTIGAKPPAGNQYTQNLTGTLLFSGTENASTSKNVSGGLSFTGNITKSTSHQLVGAVLSFSGNITKKTTHLLTRAVLSFSGTVTRAITHTLTAVLSFSGNIIKSTSHLLTGAVLSFSGTIKKSLNKGLSATLSFSGTVIRLITYPLNATLSFSGNVSKIIFHFLSGGLSFSGSVSSLLALMKSFSGSLGFSGAIIKSTKKGVSGNLSFVGNISRSILYHLNSGLSFVGNLQRGISHSFSAAVSFVGSFSTMKVAAKMLSGVLSFSANITKQTSYLLSGLLGFSGTTTKNTSKTLPSASLSFSGLLTKSISKSFFASLSLSGSIAKQIGKTLSGVLNFVGNLIGIWHGPTITTGTPDAKWKLPVTSFSWQVQRTETKWKLPIQDLSWQLDVKDKT